MLHPTQPGSNAPTIKFILILLVWSSGFCALAQEKNDAILLGKVTSASSGENIPYANVVIKGTNIGTATDGLGRFEMSRLPAGKTVVVAHAMGFKPMEKTVQLQGGTPVESDFVLEDDVLNMEQVVVTATRTKHYVKNVPVRTEIITARDIESKNAATVYEALENIPGVRVEQQCQNCNFSMVRMQGLGAEHTQVLINGKPLYTGLAGVYGLQQIGSIDIGQIEITKGAGSALYGSSAVAGAINIISKEPSYLPTVKVDMQVGSHNTNRYGLSSSIRNMKGNVGVSLYAQQMTGDAIDETAAGFTPIEVEKADGISDRVAGKLTNAGFSLFMDGLISEQDQLIIRGKSILEKRAGGTITDDYFRNPFTDGTEVIFTERYEADLGYNRKIGLTSEIDFGLAYARHNRDATNDTYLGDYIATHDGTLPDLRDMRPYLAGEDSYSATLSFATRIQNHSLLVGFQSYFDDLEESGMYVVVNPDNPFYGESYQSTSEKYAREFGVFLQDEWTAGTRLTIVPGIRVDNHNSGEQYTADQQVSDISSFPETEFRETSISPRFAIKYDLTDRFSLRANAGTGFRAPYGFSEDLHLCSGSPRVWKSSSLNAERSVSYNLSLDYYGAAFRVNMNLFRTDLKDKIAFTDAEAAVAALGYDYQWENIDDAVVQGIEMSAVANLGGHLDLGLDVAFNHGEYSNPRADWAGTPYEEDSRYISRLPSITGNLKTEYSRNDWSIALLGDFQGSMYIDYYTDDVDPVVGDLSKIKKTDPFVLFNARVARRIGQYNLYAGIDNLTNHIQDEKHLDDAAFIYAPLYGRMIYGGLTVDIQ